MKKMLLAAITALTLGASVAAFAQPPAEQRRRATARQLLRAKSFVPLGDGT